MAKLLLKLSLLFSIFILPNLSFAEKNTAFDHDRNIKDGEAFVFYIENDSRTLGGPGSDQAYSNGFKFSYIYAENRFPNWAKEPVERLKILDKGLEDTKLNFAVSLGHQIYTPNDIVTQTLIKDDRPYAGWLYLGFAVSFKEQNIGQFFEVDLGMVGPSALGKEVQNNYHNVIGIPGAEGWANTLHDEPTIQLSYQKRYKTIRNKNFDFVPYYGAGLGNVLVAAHVGSMVRLGVNIPDDFGPSRPSASEGDSFVTPKSESAVSKLSYFTFAGIRGNAIARNIFLDGNTFQESHHVKRYPFTFETEFGLGVQYAPFGITWRFVTRSPEFEERSRFNSFASINAIYLF